MNKEIKKDLDGKVCVIIGGAGLIGRAFAAQCREAGAIVIIADTDEEKGGLIAAELDATFISCDATNADSVEALVGEVEKKFGKADAVVNSIYPRPQNWGTPFEDISYEDFIAHVGLQTGPQFLTARVFVTHMKKHGGGSIVLMGSIYGIHAPRFELYEDSAVKPPVAEYAVAKGGLLALTRYLAKQYGPSGIRVNMISPGGVWDNQDKAFEEKFNAHAVLGNRMATPEDIAPTLAFLFSSASSYITGQNIIVDGGWTL